MLLKFVCMALVIAAVGAQTAHENSTTLTTGLKTAYRIYDECYKSSTGFTPCLKKKAITFVDRLSKINKISLGEEVYVVKVAEIESTPSQINNVAASSRSAEDQDEALTDTLIDKVTGFLNSRTLQITLPKVNAKELGRGMEEGRGKMKKMMGMMMMGFAMKMAGMVPIAIAGLFLLAGKALITSKIALLLAGVIALKKLLGQKHEGGGGHESHGWSGSGGSGGGGGGWDRRSINPKIQAEAQKLAYNSYAP